MLFKLTKKFFVKEKSGFMKRSIMPDMMLFIKTVLIFVVFHDFFNCIIIKFFFYICLRIEDLCLAMAHFKSFRRNCDEGAICRV